MKQYDKEVDKSGNGLELDNNDEIQTRPKMFHTIKSTASYVHDWLKRMKKTYKDKSSEAFLWVVLLQSKTESAFVDDAVCDKMKASAFKVSNIHDSFLRLEQSLYKMSIGDIDKAFTFVTIYLQHLISNKDENKVGGGSNDYNTGTDDCDGSQDKHDGDCSNNVPLSNNEC